MNEQTASQKRVLCFLTASQKWHTLLELDQIRLLHDDDVLCVPSLVERGLVDHQAALGGMVRITPAGQVIAVERCTNG